MDFSVIIEDTLLSLCQDPELSIHGNNNVLAIVNDFEDGKWRSSKFHNFIWDNIAETSLSYIERESLVDQSHSKLIAAAQSLRLTDVESNDIGRGSELAEIFLYGIMKNHYGALPVVPKIFYKQNAQDNAKGADSVHIVISEDKDFTIWFGEAKFFNDISDGRLSSIITSVGNSLKTDKLKRENSIITNLSDLDCLIDDSSLATQIKSALSARNSIDDIKPKLHIPILLIHECEITSETTSLSEEYLSKLHSYYIDRSKSYFSKHIKKLEAVHLYDEITFHLILFPVPEKEKIVSRFIRQVKHYKEEAGND